MEINFNCPTASEYVAVRYVKNGWIVAVGGRPGNGIVPTEYVASTPQELAQLIHDWAVAASAKP